MKALIISPHPDDEINLAGQFIISLEKIGYRPFVLYTTNGDAEKKINNSRINEAINACKTLGIDKSNVIFLGYANDWNGLIHIYNSNNDSVLTSLLGKKKTNSLKNIPEYCFAKCGVHHNFTRRNFKEDYKNAITEIRPDLIICPEFDSHPDHRAASLMFDEVIGEILKKDINYHPLIFKKYIHEGVWYGPKDYYSFPMRETLTKGARTYSNGVHDLDSPCFKWEERVSFKADPVTLTPLIKKNVVYKAAQQHKVTTAWYEMQRVINADTVYWNRRTDNIALISKVVTSSGNASYINDFKLYDSDDVLDIKEPFLNSNSYCWRPDPSDNEKYIIIQFPKEQRVSLIKVFEDCNSNNHIENLHISFGIDSEFDKDLDLNNDGTASELPIKNKIITDKVLFNITKWTGVPGISEIEIYSNDNDEHLSNFVCRYNSTFKVQNPTKFRRITWLMQRIEKTFLMIKFLFKFKMKYEISKILN